MDESALGNRDKRGFWRPNKKLNYGEIIIIQPSHCDPTVNLYDKCYLIEKDKISKYWFVDARGYG